MKPYLFIVLIFSIGLMACGGRNVDRFSAEKPYAIEFSKERSIYQAEKLTNRLLEMDIDAYIIRYTDTLRNDGGWYYILCGDMETSDEAQLRIITLQEDSGLESLKVVQYEKFGGSELDIDRWKAQEEKRINARRPIINEDLFEVVGKFPESNALMVHRAFVLNTPPDHTDMKGFDVAYKFNLDLPRGISRKLMLQNTTAFSEVIYKDNLYGDRVTIDIGKLRSDKPEILRSGFLSDDAGDAYKLADEYADLILETGDYDIEQKEIFSVDAFTRFHGYKVTISTQKGDLRTYLILVDNQTKFVIFCQSTDKTEEELIEILSDIGKGDGLLDYHEFYNTFYTVPEQRVDNDLFVGFMMDKLDRSYARERNNAKWSRKMVGYWSASSFFYNEGNGLWGYSIFDLLTKENQEYIYGGLYTNVKSRNKRQIRVYGTDGFAKYSRSYRTGRNKLGEVNFGIDRYVTAVGNSKRWTFTKDDLVQRAESLQLDEIID